MILGIGIDMIEIRRFAQWHQRPRNHLERIFSSQEIAYCLEHTVKSAERFAVRFAAKEACYKVLSPYFKHKVSLFKLCSHVEVSTAPIKLTIKWHMLDLTIGPSYLRSHLSLTHSATHASAVVILEYLDRALEAEKKPFFY